jgi:hypothetical protein
MGVPADKFYTVQDATTAAALAKVQMRLMATAMADALAEAQGAQPGACERIVRILGKARDEHLARIRGGQ